MKGHHGCSEAVERYLPLGWREEQEEGGAGDRGLNAPWARARARARAAAGSQGRNLGRSGVEARRGRKTSGRGDAPLPLRATALRRMRRVSSGRLSSSRLILRLVFLATQSLMSSRLAVLLFPRGLGRLP